MEILTWFILGVSGLLGGLWLIIKAPQSKEYYVLQNNVSTNYFINKNDRMKGKY